jgi:hypothetical protein
MKAVESKEMLVKATGAATPYDIIVVGRSNCTADENSTELADLDDIEQNVVRNGSVRRSRRRTFSEMSKGRGGSSAGDIFGHSGIRLSEMTAPVLVVSGVPNVISGA